MKASEIEIGGIYNAKITNDVVPVRLEEVRDAGGWWATNLVTNNRVQIKSARKLRGHGVDPNADDDTKADQLAKRVDAKRSKTAAAAAEDGDASSELKELLGPDKKKSKKKKKKASSKNADQPKVDRAPSGLDLAATILKRAQSPLTAKVIAERVIAAGWKTEGKTPNATLYAAIMREINTKKKDSRFKKVGKGQFTNA